MKVRKPAIKMKCQRCGFVGAPNIKKESPVAAYCSRCGAYIDNLPMKISQEKIKKKKEI